MRSASRSIAARSRLRIYRGDLRTVLPTLPANSIHACVCDPPYDLTTTGRSFQGSGGSRDQRTGRTRSDRRTTGFMGLAWDGTGVAFEVATWRAVLRVLKPGAYLVAFGGTRTSHRMVSAIEDAGFEIRDSIAWLYGSGFPKSLNLGTGHGTALKPGNEPIAVARKPFTGTNAANLTTHGTGALNIDACRIPGAGWSRQDGTSGAGFKAGKFMGVVGRGQPTRQNGLRASACGRWPANVLLDEDAAECLDAQTGTLSLAGNTHPATQNVGGVFGGGRISADAVYQDQGGASRFFYCAKPSRKERNAGCEALVERRSQKVGNGLRSMVGHPSGDHGQTSSEDRRPRNFHPTVKPVALLRWLVRLVTPIGGTVLDCFAGSGTTGMACAMEQRSCVLIERERRYLPIIRARVRAASYADHRTGRRGKSADRRVGP